MSCLLSFFSRRTRFNRNRKLVREPQAQCNFERDGRSKQVIFVAHCVLNQNARDAGTADFAAMMKPLLRCLEQEDIGIVQLPCPEVMILGLDRNISVPALEKIREKIELPESQAKLAPLVEQVVHQIGEYRRHGFQVVAILGKNGSPSCGVQTTGWGCLFGQSEGVFMRLLRARLKSEAIQVEMKGIEDHRQQEVIDWVLKRT